MGYIARILAWVKVNLTHENIISYYDAFKRFLGQSWLSLFVILMVILMSKFGQGQTIFIDLVDHNWLNLLLFFFLIDGMSMILSHYPIYIEKWNLRSLRMRKTVLSSEDNEDNTLYYSWQIDNKGIPFPWLKRTLKWFHDHFHLGFITFSKPPEGPDATENTELYGFIKNLRKLLGVSFYLAFLNLLITSYVTVEGWDIHPNSLFVPLSLAAVIIFVAIQNLPASKKVHQDHNNNDDSLTTYWVRGIDISFYASWIMRIILLVATMTLGWSAEVAILTSLVLMVDIVKFSFFRKYRSAMGRPTHLWNFYRGIIDNTTYLFSMSLAGFLSYIIIVYAHLYFFKVNSLLIILAYLNVLYGLFILPVKTYLLHRYRQLKGDLASTWSGVVTMAIPLLGVVLVGYFIFAANRGNQLHKIPLVQEESERVVRTEEYIQSLKSHFAGHDTMYFIASYGGGLKANAWNMLLLEELKERNILTYTAGMSGVSGGSLGQAFFTGLYKTFPENKLERNIRARDISTSDFLSIDATYTLGWDLLRELYPGDKKMGPDRAIIAMKAYAHKSGGEQMFTQTFREYWGDLFRYERTRSDFFPAILSNSAGTHIQRGIASSVDFGNDFNTIFHDATDILSFTDPSRRGWSLPYAYAISPSNRFPVFSPAGKIEEKGHFVDGGYFENSGLGTLMDLYEFIDGQLDSLMPSTVIFLQITNSAKEYIKSCVDTLGVSKRIFESSEISAILSTITSTDMMPRYLIDKAKKNKEIRFRALHLPYRFHKGDLDKVFKGDVDLNRHEVNSFIGNHNARLDSIIFSKTSGKYDVIPPPLARMLGKQGYRYMEVMLDHAIESGLDRD